MKTPTTTPIPSPLQIFDVTYDITTTESAEHGENEERGFISQAARLRDAVKDLFETRTCETAAAYIEADCWPITRDTRPRCITVANGPEHSTGDYETRYLHIPEHLTPATARRIARLILRTF